MDSLTIAMLTPPLLLSAVHQVSSSTEESDLASSHNLENRSLVYNTLSSNDTISNVFISLETETTNLIAYPIAIDECSVNRQYLFKSVSALWELQVKLFKCFPEYADFFAQRSIDVKLSFDLFKYLISLLEAKSIRKNVDSKIILRIVGNLVQLFSQIPTNTVEAYQEQGEERGHCSTRNYLRKALDSLESII